MLCTHIQEAYVHDSSAGTFKGDDIYTPRRERNYNTSFHPAKPKQKDIIDMQCTYWLHLESNRSSGGVGTKD